MSTSKLITDQRPNYNLSDKKFELRNLCRNDHNQEFALLPMGLTGTPESPLYHCEKETHFGMKNIFCKSQNIFS